ncbi:ATP-binding cassette domain-containing protein [Streptomyces bauhiniae]
MPSLHLHDLTKRFTRHTALHGLSLTVQNGEIFTLLGPSGCGKSTTLWSIAGLHRPDSGSIAFGDRVVFDHGRVDVEPEHRNCGVVFQSYAIWPHMSVAANVGYPLKLRRTAKVEGSRFEPAPQHTIKLEGGRLSGYEAVSFTGIRDPCITAHIDRWARLLRTILTERVEQTLGLGDDDYGLDIRLYGHNAILEHIDPDTTPPREVGVMLLVNAPTQAAATAIAKVANPLMLHLPLPEMQYLPSFAFPTSPAETERGPAYEFVLNHTVDADSPTSMFRIRHTHEDTRA